MPTFRLPERLITAIERPFRIDWRSFKAIMQDFYKNCGGCHEKYQEKASIPIEVTRYVSSC